MKEFFKNFKFVFSYVKKQKSNIIKYLISQIFLIIISVVVPIISANVIIKLTNNQLNQVLYMVFGIFIIEITRNVFNYISFKNTQIIYRKTLIKLQNDLGKEILKIENKVIDENGSGGFIQKLTNDTSRLSDIFIEVTNNLTGIITNIGIFGTIFVINKIAFLYLLFSVIILYFVDSKRVKVFTKNDKEYRKENDKISGFVGEIIRGIRDIKMLNAEKSFLNTLNSKVYSVNQKRYKMGDINRKYNFLYSGIRDLIDLLLIVLLVYEIRFGKLNAATSLVIHNYSGRVQQLTFYIGMLLEKIKDFNLSSSRVSEIMSNSLNKEKFGNKHLDKVNGNFEFKDVYFKYDKKMVLNGLSFEIKANETVAFVGKSGTGKTTIFNLLCKMYNINKGDITIDKISINELDKDSIRGNITIISQNPYIFNLSIKENLKLVKDNLTDKEIKEACKIACLDDFINSLPDKYDTVVGEGGITLSGGQKQRLAIARALIQKTEIILFDEATSALDNETQTKIQEAISNMKGEYTILIIAHRLSTIINSDRILVIDDGKIVGEGTHEELLKKNKFYEELYNAEIKK